MPKRTYENMDPVPTLKSFQQLNRWRKERRLKRKDLTYVVPHAEPELKWLNSNREETAVTWIGHSTFLIQHSGLNIVTDPVWAGTMGFAKRLAAPGIAIEGLPDIDIVLLSHAHYDHLHIASLRQLPGEPLLLVPAGLSRMLKRKGFKRVQELAWWEETVIGSARFTFVPAQHWTRRTLWDTNSSHWGGWIVQGGKLSDELDSARHVAAGREDGQATDASETHHASECAVPAIPTVYFAGDSGYFRGFREIGERFPNIDCVLMPIGAYEPEWFMGAQHVTPEEAIRAYLDVGGRQFVPMHYGAFRLADDTPREALDRLEAEWRRLELDPAELKLLMHGETLRLGGADRT